MTMIRWARSPSRSASVQIDRANVAFMKNQILQITPARGVALRLVTLLSVVWLGGCVTHYYPAPATYAEYGDQGEYAAVTANVSEPIPGIAATNVVYTVDSAYYPWWSLDYLYLGYGYGWGRSGLSIGFGYGYPRPYYGWRPYAWYNPWYYPPYYSAWYPSHYWRPYYHPHHYYWSHRYHRQPRYGHRPVHDRYASNDAWRTPDGSNGQRARTERPSPTGGVAYPSRPGQSSQPVAGSLARGANAQATPLRASYRPPVPSSAERLSARPPALKAVSPSVPAAGQSLSVRPGQGTRLISQSPGFTGTNSSTVAQKPEVPVNSARVIGQPVYRSPTARASTQSGGSSSVSQSRGIPVRPTTTAPAAPAGNIGAASPQFRRPVANPAPINPVRNVPSSRSPVRAAPSMARPQPAVRPAPSTRSYVPRNTRPVQSPRMMPSMPSKPRVSAPPRAAPRSRPASPAYTRPKPDKPR